MTALLELNRVSKQYDDDIILSDISVAVGKGQVIAIIGDSGGGKTTLLSIMGLLQNPTGGKIFLDGREVSALDMVQQAKLRNKYFGFVFQRARLINSLSALENVMVPAWIAKAGGSMEKRAGELLRHFNLGKRLHYKPQALSLGQLRRVALARALLLNPPILLVDEPTNDLDPKLAAAVSNDLLQARETGASVVIVTHDYDLAARADEVFKLEEGKLQRQTGNWKTKTDISLVADQLTEG